MGIAELQALWQIARSPKDDGTERKAESDRVAARKLIGKFGIGKLASYQLGRRITHLCKVDGRFLLVTIDFGRLLFEEESSSTDGVEGQDGQDLEGKTDTEADGAGAATGGTATSSENEHGEAAGNGAGMTGERQVEESTADSTAPILELSEEEAKTWIGEQFQASEGAAFDEIWSKPAWTLAVVDELRGSTLTPGRLRWVLGRSMPLRPDFRIFVNDDAVESKFSKGTLVHWDLSTDQIKRALRAEWKTARDAGKVVGDLEFRESHEHIGDNPEPAAIFPELGEVRAEIDLFKDSLVGSAADHYGRSHGFFIMVRGRLLNPDDGLVLLDPPSFGTYYRSQIVLQADGLDEDLMADRERLQKTSPRLRELQVLQEAVYLAARNELQRIDEEAARSFFRPTVSMRI
jgi:hypothetical protein